MRIDRRIAALPAGAGQLSESFNSSLAVKTCPVPGSPFGLLALLIPVVATLVVPFSLRDTDFFLERLSFFLSHTRTQLEQWLLL